MSMCINVCGYIRANTRKVCKWVVLDAMRHTPMRCVLVELKKLLFFCEFVANKVNTHVERIYEHNVREA